MLILAAFAHVISIEERNLVAPELARLFRNGRNRLAILSLATAISIAPQFWEWTLFGVPTRLYIWYLPLISYCVGRLVRPQGRSSRISSTAAVTRKRPHTQLGCSVNRGEDDLRDR